MWNSFFRSPDQRSLLSLGDLAKSTVAIRHDTFSGDNVQIQLYSHPFGTMETAEFIYSAIAPARLVP